MKILSNDNYPMRELEKDQIIEKVSYKFQEILDLLYFDTDNDQQIKDTPTRWAKMMVNELLKGCYEEEPTITVFENTKEYDEMIFVGPIQIKSICSHHFLPFFGSAYLAYLPDKYIIGISKFSRIVKHFMRRPQIQEELTKQIAEYIDTRLKPIGCGVYIKAVHTCMTLRGVEENLETKMITSALKGNFLSPEVKDEFQKMIGNSK